MSIKHLVPYICSLKRGNQGVPADAPKTAKQQCTFDLSLHNNSGCDNTNYKSKQSVDQFRQRRAKYMRAYSTNRSAYAKQKEASCKTSARLKQTPEARQKRAEYMRAYHAKRSADAKQKEASYKRAYKAKKALKPKEKACESQSSIMKQYRTNSLACCTQDFIYKFHNIVSQGPMYTCSCCDQLWYRHSVSSPHKLRKSKPSVDKYVLNKTSVDNTDWMYIMCEILNQQ